MINISRTVLGESTALGADKATIVDLVLSLASLAVRLGLSYYSFFQ